MAAQNLLGFKRKVNDKESDLVEIENANKTVNVLQIEKAVDYEDARVGRQSAKARSEKLGRELANLGERLNGDDEWHAVFNQRIVLPQFLKDRGYVRAISVDEVTPDDIGEEVVTDDDDDETLAADVQQVSCTSQDENVSIFEELKLKKAEYLKMEADFNRDMQQLTNLEKKVADLKESLPKQREKLKELKEKVAELEKTTGTTQKYADLARTNKAFFRSTDWNKIELVDENESTNEPSTSGPSSSQISLPSPNPTESSGPSCSEPLSPVIPTSNLNLLERVTDVVQNNDESYGTLETISKSLKRKANEMESYEDGTQDAAGTRNVLEIENAADCAVSRKRSIKESFNNKDSLYWVIFPGSFNKDEDRVFLKCVGNAIFLALFDGHGGSEASEYCAQHLFHIFWQRFQGCTKTEKVIISLLYESFEVMQEELKTQVGKWPAYFEKKTGRAYASTAGTTASVVFIYEKNVYVANVGDSPVFRIVEAEAEEKLEISLVSQIHTPEDQNELLHCFERGGAVDTDNNQKLRVCWQRSSATDSGREKSIPFLDMTRALGDFWSLNPKTNVTTIDSTPSISTYKLSRRDRFVLITSDGITEYINSFEIANFVNKFLLKNQVENIAEELCKEVEKRSANKIRDDCSVILLDTKILY